MANDYFDFLSQNAQQDKPTDSTPQNDGMVNLTARADADCQVVCDGDFLFLLNANQIAKEKAPAGQHILQFISIEYPEVAVEKLVDFPDVGKNYLVVVNELKAQIATLQAKSEQKPPVVTTVPKEKKAYVVIYQDMEVEVYSAYSDLNSANNALQLLNDSDLDCVIKECTVPESWNRFYIALYQKMDSPIATLSIYDSSDSFPSILARWENGLKGQVDNMGNVFGSPSCDVSHGLSEIERCFLSGKDVYFYLLQVPGFDIKY